MTRYVLPDLPYEYDALEPFISAQIVELHHDKHHRAYVDGANKAIETLLDIRHSDHFDSIAAVQKQLAFNVSGHVLHSIYWKNMRPSGGGEPTGDLASAIARDFGSFATFKKQMTTVASTIMGSGWAALVYEPVSKRLGTTQIHDHQSDVTQGGVPLLVIDAWEHAWYLQYKTEKAKHFDAIWNTWNWDDVAARLDAARALDLQIDQASDFGSEIAFELTH